MLDKDFFSGYENSVLESYDSHGGISGKTTAYIDLGTQYVPGVLIANYHRNGRLEQVYSADESHVGVIAATRMGKTTSYVIPTIVSFAKQKEKRSMLIADPKGELYRKTAATLKEQGYKVMLLNFRNYRNSECWNMLTPIFRKYQKAHNTADEVRVVKGSDPELYVFQDKFYSDISEVKREVDTLRKIRMEDVNNDIDLLANMFLTTEGKDPYWEDAAREFLKAFIYAMLEDSVDPAAKRPITEDTFSFNTIFNIYSTFGGDSGDRYSAYNDRGYFSSRSVDSMAYKLAYGSVIGNAPTTRKCVVSMFAAKLAGMRESTVRLLTSCNSFDMSELTSDKPVALFINFRDEVRAHYDVISLFLQDAYRLLIEKANGMPDGKLKVPFYFILDEFGNFPKMRDFESTISACAGRNIFFVLIVQSYAQLNCVYGKDVAEIIRDNLNVHVFFGSNNPGTLEEFSRECGQFTRISPASVLSGKGADIEHYQTETIPLMPKSRLASLAPGECIVTEAASGRVRLSSMERYFMCKELKDLPNSDISEYKCPIDPLDKKYIYNFTGKNITPRFSL